MSAKNTQQLKQLQVRKTKLEVQVKEADEIAKVNQQQASKLRNQLNTVNKEIKELRDSEPVVSEHAMLRYIERAMGINLDMVKEAILTEENVVLIENLGSGKYPIGDGLKAVVRGKTVVSIV